MQLKLLIVILGVTLGSIAVMAVNTAEADYQNIGIAPTNAFDIINVQTSPWAASDTLVEADVYNQKIYFVSDGSVIFNVTDAFNATHAVP
jgi:hypothetical protein